jgi:hypothetical protein
VLPGLGLELPEVGQVAGPAPGSGQAEATVFDFAAVSVAVHVPFRLPADGLTRLAAWLADPGPVIAAARAAVRPLHEKLLPAIRDPLWHPDLSEDYFVFQLLPGSPYLPPALLGERAGWLAGLVRLEASPLSAEEVAEALRARLSYSPEDLLVADWAAAVLVDRQCEETLQAIELANLQLLEYRHTDDRLDDRLATAYRLVRRARSRLPLWRSQHRALRALGELKVETNELFERTGNVLKLVGDPYLARVYRLVATRFGLRQWEQSIQRKLEVAEGVYEVLADQTATYRMEFLEIIIILLILVEVVRAFLVNH